jgi:hypothetical protein
MDLIEKGRTLVCELGDYDACDRYFFHIEDAAESLTTTWKLKGCPDNGTLRIMPNALRARAGMKLIGLSQGSVSRWKCAVASSTEECEDGCDCHVPPFLLSRAAHKALKKGQPVELNVFGEVVTFTKKKKALAKRTLLIDGTQTIVETLHATAGTDGDLWFVDDPRWPLIVRVELADGEHYSDLGMVSSEPSEVLEAELAAGRRQPNQGAR